MWVYLNDGRKVNMFWVVSFYQNKDEVIYEVAKGHGNNVIEPFETEDDAKARVEELESMYVK